MIEVNIELKARDEIIKPDFIEEKFITFVKKIVINKVPLVKLTPKIKSVNELKVKVLTFKKINGKIGSAAFFQ